VGLTRWGTARQPAREGTEWYPGIGRRRDQEFADVFMEEIRTKSVREAILAAGKRLDWHWAGDGWRRVKTDAQILRQGRKILARGSVIEYMTHYFDAVGFTALDGARMLKRHIEGDITKEVMTKDGTVEEVKLPPSLDALKHYHALTLEKQTTKVEIDQRTLVAHRMMTSEPPKMRARELKTALPAAKDD